jgi:hypothetical protein
MNSSHVIFNSNTLGSDQLPRSAIMKKKEEEKREAT